MIVLININNTNATVKLNVILTVIVILIKETRKG